MYVFVRQYQKSLDSVRVNVGLNSTAHLQPACVELTGIVVYRSEETFDHAKCVFIQQFIDSEEEMMNLCKEFVYFPEESWKSFVSAYMNRIENKQRI